MSFIDNVPLHELLPPEICIGLSPTAGQVYSTLWNAMSFKQATQINLSDDVLSKRARVPMTALQDARDELQVTGLMLTTVNHDLFRYEFPEPQV